ncbi:MAG: hypothetical protein K9N06_03525 [Candidatus Cloacimonetes bacterium]|nr:hypothetical protein [Candidatus Cloacimonadota bacterium]
MKKESGKEIKLDISAKDLKAALAKTTKEVEVLKKSLDISVNIQKRIFNC